MKTFSCLVVLALVCLLVLGGPAEAQRGRGGYGGGFRGGVGYGGYYGGYSQFLPFQSSVQTYGVPSYASYSYYQPQAIIQAEVVPPVAIQPAPVIVREVQQQVIVQPQVEYVYSVPTRVIYSSGLNYGGYGIGAYSGGLNYGGGFNAYRGGYGGLGGIRGRR